MTHRLPTRARAIALVAVALAAAVATGCGLAASKGQGNTQLLVTADFGDRTIAQTDRPQASGSDTVVALLERNAPGVRTGPHSAVRSVAGVTGPWTVFVNGIAQDPAKPPANVRQGDRVWFDEHPTSVAPKVRAIVGQYPEPFLHGVNGRRLPTRVECIVQDDPACTAVTDRLVGLGLPAAKGGLANSMVKDTLRVLVGPWQALRGDVTAALLERGPRASGVFARPAPDGKSIAMLDARGRPTRTLHAGAGLVAATAAPDGEPVWIVTGTDERGIQAAANAFDEGALTGRFAVAVVGGQPLALPDRGRAAGVLSGG